MNKFISSKKRKVIDTFPFFNEFELLKLRLNYLNDVVDYFIICECNHTHSAIPKPYYLDQIIEDIPEDIRKKIIRIKYEVDGRYYYNDHWRLESEHRDFIGKNLSQFSGNDIVMINDIDEIPNKEYIKKVFNTLNENFLYVAEFEMFYYNFTTYADLNHLIVPWHGTVISSVKKCIEIGSDTLHKKRRDSGYEVIKNGGWHFTYFNSPEKIKLKLESFAHYELNSDEYKNNENIIDSIKNRTYFADKSQKFIKYEFGNYPEELREWIINIFPEEYYNN
jgi:hypothetical protein